MPLSIRIRLLGAFAPNTPLKERRASSKWESLTAYWLCFYSAIFYNSNFVLIDMILAGRNTVNKI